MYWLYEYFLMFFVKICDIFNKYNQSQVVNSEHVNDNDIKKVTIMTYNIDGLFCHYNSHRIKALIKDIISIIKNKDIDIFCFQEVWHYDLHNKIIELAVKENLNYAFPSNKKRYWLGESSGLITLSRFLIKDQQIYTYENRIGACALTNKGAQYLTVKLNNHKDLNIINTHLQSSHHNYFQDFQHVTFKQIKELIENCPFNDFVVTGDLNLDYNYLKNNLKGEINFFKNYKRIITCPYSQEHLDHFLYKGVYNLLTENKIIDIHNSDHLPFILTINLRSIISYNFLS